MPKYIKKDEKDFLKLDNSGKYFSFCNVDGYNKPFNFIAFGRESGKTTAIEVVKTFKSLIYGRGNVVLIKRFENDISTSSIQTIEGRLNRFFPCKIVNITGITTGAATFDIIFEKKVYKKVMLLWLGRTQKLKNIFINDVRWILWDEYNINPMNEKYGDDEFQKFIEFYKTISRFSKYIPRCYFLGNTYSKYSPFCDYFHVPYNKIKRNCKLIGDNWAYFNFQFTEERKKELLENDPIYKNDKNYACFALEGDYIFDKLLKTILPNRPKYFKLKFYFNIEQTYIAVFKGYTEKFKYYLEEIKEPFKNTKKKIYAFDFYENNLNLKHELNNEADNYRFIILNNSITKNKVRYNNINSFNKINKIFNKFLKFI